jgi:2-methylaconitate cis-trans-isomerase PrpF
VSVLDVVNPVVFVRAADLGLKGTELPDDIDGNSTLLDRIERLRGAACEALGYVDDACNSANISPGVPKLAFLSESRTYTTSDGETVRADEINLTARIMSMQKLHPVYGVSGASCTAAAALLPGTIPNRIVDSTDEEVVLGHPKGPMAVTAEVDSEARDVKAVTVPRTQRRLIEGMAYFQPDA